MGVSGPVLDPGDVDMSDPKEISGTSSVPGLAPSVEGALLLEPSRSGMTQGLPWCSITR